MSSTFAIRFGADRSALGVVVPTWQDLASAVRQLELGGPRPVVVVVGGADLADRDLVPDLSPPFDVAVVPAMTTVGAIGVDGGTDSGVMGVFGTALAGSGRPYALVGVVAEGTVRLPTEQPVSTRAPLEPHHSHFVLVPGGSWGDESRWLARTASVLAAGAPSLTLVANGGDVTYDDVEHSLAEGRAVVALRGSGRTADDLAAAVSGRRASVRAVGLADSGLVLAQDVADHAGLATLLVARLTGGEAGPEVGGRAREGNAG